MTPSKIEDDLFPHLGPLPPHHEPFMDTSHPSIDDDVFLAEIDLFCDDEDNEGSHSSSDAEIALPPPNNEAPSQNPNSANSQLISPDPHISSQFYTFNRESHALMIRCLIEGRLATPEEIRAATPLAVLNSWRSVWKDRNEVTAFSTAWKRIQEKLTVHVADSSCAFTGNGHFLCFKNNSNQFVSHVGQWQDIVMSFHSDSNFKHLGLRETIDRIKQVCTVGTKFYGIPESYIRTCVAACSVCSDESSGCAPRSKRRRFEYTESFEIPAKEVPIKLQQLALKHKVVLCIRQKYIRYKPFMAEVKDYACHRAGEPASSKKSRIVKREPYTSKRCGCGFRIRAIVPITNYNEKDKTFVYEEEGTAVFKMYAVHSGHEPGPLDGNARIMHRMVGHKGSLFIDQDVLYGIAEEGESGGFGLTSGEMRNSIPHQLLDLRNELVLLEGRIGKTPPYLLGSVSRELFDVVKKLKSIADDGSKSDDNVLVVEHDLPDWGEDHHTRMYGNGKEGDIIEDDEDSFGRTFGEVACWDQMRVECGNEKDIVGQSCKEEKWLGCDFVEEKGILSCSLSNKLVKPLRNDDVIETDIGLSGIQIDGFFPENPKWLDSPSVLDTRADCGDGGF